MPRHANAIPRAGCRSCHRTNLDNLSAPALYQTLPLGDVQGLTVGVSCQAVCAPGENRTMLTRRREGGAPWAMTSNQTSPANDPAGPFTLGFLDWISNIIPSCPVAAAAFQLVVGDRAPVAL